MGELTRFGSLCCSQTEAGPGPAQEDTTARGAEPCSNTNITTQQEQDAQLRQGNKRKDRLECAAPQPSPAPQQAGIRRYLACARRRYLPAGSPEYELLSALLELRVSASTVRKLPLQARHPALVPATCCLKHAGIAAKA